jgi:propane monooxygenase reductase subunit
MADKHVVRFEPVGIEIEVDEDQTVLRAAAEQGLMLMHGCKEGQCSACKSFVLDGDDIELDRYSTFATTRGRRGSRCCAGPTCTRT